MTNGKSLNRLVSECITQPTLTEALLDERKRIAALSEREFTDEEMQVMLGIEAQDVEDFFRQAREGLGLTSEENQRKGIERGG